MHFSRLPHALRSTPFYPKPFSDTPSSPPSTPPYLSGLLSVPANTLIMHKYYYRTSAVELSDDADVLRSSGVADGSSIFTSLGTVMPSGFFAVTVKLLDCGHRKRAALRLGPEGYTGEPYLPLPPASPDASKGASAGAGAGDGGGGEGAGAQEGDYDLLEAEPISDDGEGSPVMAAAVAVGEAEAEMEGDIEGGTACAVIDSAASAGSSALPPAPPQACVSGLFGATWGNVSAGLNVKPSLYSEPPELKGVVATANSTVAEMRAEIHARLQKAGKLAEHEGPAFVRLRQANVASDTRVPTAIMRDGTPIKVFGLEIGYYGINMIIVELLCEEEHLPAVADKTEELCVVVQGWHRGDWSLTPARELVIPNSCLVTDLAAFLQSLYGIDKTNHVEALFFSPWSREPLSLHKLDTYVKKPHDYYAATVWFKPFPYTISTHEVFRTANLNWRIQDGGYLLISDASVGLRALSEADRSLTVQWDRANKASSAAASSSAYTYSYPTYTPKAQGGVTIKKKSSSSVLAEDDKDGAESGGGVSVSVDVGTSSSGAPSLFDGVDDDADETRRRAGEKRSSGLLVRCREEERGECAFLRCRLSVLFPSNLSPISSAPQDGIEGAAQARRRHVDNGDSMF